MRLQLCRWTFRDQEVEGRPDACNEAHLYKVVSFRGSSGSKPRYRVDTGKDHGKATGVPVIRVGFRVESTSFRVEDEILPFIFRNVWLRSGECSFSNANPILLNQMKKPPLSEVACDWNRFRLVYGTGMTRRNAYCGPLEMSRLTDVEPFVPGISWATVCHFVTSLMARRSAVPRTL